MERREGQQCGEEGLSNGPHSPAVPSTCMGEAPGVIPEIVFAEVIRACTSLRSTGCVLCWLLVQGMVPGVHHTGNSSFVALVISLLGAKTQGYPKRKKGAAFPIKEGELCVVKEKFANLPFQAFRDEDFVQRWYLDAWLFICFLSLNFLWGAVAGLPPGHWLQSDKMAVESVRAAIQRRCLDDVFLPTSEADWEKELASRMVGYGGEEVSTCHVLTYEQVEPALPPASHGGCVELVDWVGARTKEFLLNPKRLLRPQDEVQLPKLPGKIHMRQEDQLKIAQELIRRNVCDWVDLDLVYKVNGVPILNGLFGVPKSSLLSDGRPILRFIMNLTGSNATQYQLEGLTGSLPSITTWQSIFIDEGETLQLFQSDMSSAFYLFRIPRAWLPYLAFNLVVSGSVLGRDPRKRFALACTVLPMGWLSSVGIMQEASEMLLRRGPIHKGGQLSRSKPIPEWFNEVLLRAGENHRAWWHVYLDNFAAGERVTRGDPSLDAMLCHQLAEEAWNQAGIISSDKKRVKSAEKIVELGAEINGASRFLGASSERMLKLIQATLWGLNQEVLSRKKWQIIAGRWIFVLQFRRPGMSILNRVWGFTSRQEKVSKKLKSEMQWEFLLCVGLSPLLHCNLGASIPRLISASDASETGGAVGFSTSLTPAGEDCLHASCVNDKDYVSAPVLLLSLFNGIGGAFRAYDVAGVTPCYRIAVECDKAANRITLRTWPGTELVKDVALVTRPLVREWSRKYSQVEEIHLWAGFPCTELSRVKFDRLNLEGGQSKLFWEIPRIRTLLEEEFGSDIVIKEVLENVASMDREACQEISQELGRSPYRVDCVQAVPMRRPRYCWCTEEPQFAVTGLELTKGPYWTEVVASAPYPEVKDWKTPGYDWWGELEGAVFPTCMKSIPRRVPPPKPAGLEKSSVDAIGRWTADSYRFPPYQYEDRFIFSSQVDGSWRLLSADEKELLLGYGWHHTRLAMAASEAKQNETLFNDKRHSLLGDSFSIFSFAIFAVACCKNFLPAISYVHLTRRLGLAPGFRAPIRRVAPLRRSLQYGTPLMVLQREKRLIDDFNRLLLRRTNHTGSDIRVITGDILAPKQFPRQSVSASWWNWEEGFTTKWSRKEHINILELRSVLLAVQFQVSRFKIHDARVFHLSDSYVSISVASKGRSGSKQLQRLLQQLSAQCLAFGLQLILAHVDSSENPTDEGSRR